MIIETARAASWLRFIDFPSRTALAAVNLSVPKSSSGTSPRPALGASWTHSAEEFDELYWTVALYERPVVLFLIEIVHSPLALCEIEVVTESPGFTESETVREDCGSISTHASYVTEPPPTLACVPAWIRSRLLRPPIPTHVASAPVEVAETCGTTHVAVTAVKLPPFAT